MNVYEIKQAARKERFAELAEKSRERADALYEKGTKALEAIPFGQPILVGHHSEKSDRSYRARAVGQIDRSFKEAEKAEYYERRAEGVNLNGISSDDPDAVKKLSEKVASLETVQARMKEENAVARKEGKEKPFPTWQLSNNNANIRRIKERITELQKKAELTTEAPVTGDGWTKKEDLEDNRILFLFDGKPDEERRSLLKRNGFKWSPTRGAWVRMLNGNGRYAANRVIQSLNA